MNKKKSKNNGKFVIQTLHSIPTTVDTVCGMSVYRNDRLPWIQQAVKSILGQTTKVDLFVIVLDGFVPEEISRWLADIQKDEKSIVIIHSVDNVGLSTCMNFVIDYVRPFRPRYFFRMDSDDISVLHRFEKQINLLDKHPDVDVLGSALCEINEEGDKVGRRRLPTKHTQLLKSISRRCPFNHPTVAIRFSVFEDGYRYQPEMLNTQDYFLWVTLAANGYKFANVKEPLLHFRRINGFYKRRGRGKSLNEFKARLSAIKLLKQHSVRNYLYALTVLSLRMMPGFVIKFAYKIDRFLLNLKRHH
ncbi:glycosyltransferase [Shewanella maritima]|uniref:glycosyltransferase n=1 Tax=Shewanella maritima TaxID=2520507 RepID=UPI0037350153